MQIPNANSRVPQMKPHNFYGKEYLKYLSKEGSVALFTLFPVLKIE